MLVVAQAEMKATEVYLRQFIRLDTAPSGAAKGFTQLLSSLQYCFPCTWKQTLMCKIGGY